ncbi:hypothetical protein [Yersinia massiliensis]|uniref:hypothetical protein n=1 Tax=Yersinia massiliensis TaxID=419257 RepID=UPI000311922C|nr:hypothetical protein [Yersinia massiliensis]
MNKAFSFNNISFTHHSGDIDAIKLALGVIIASLPREQSVNIMKTLGEINEDSVKNLHRDFNQLNPYK